jgi:lysophospholipase L1-like esterase
MFEPSLVILMAGVNNTWSLAESNLGAFLPPGRWQTHVFRLRRWSDDVKVVRLVRLLALGGGEAWRRLGRDLEGEPTLARWPPEPDPLVAGIGEQAFLRLWRSDVGGMIRQAKAAGADVILMTYPNYEMPPIAEFAAMAATWSLPLVENHESFAPLIARGRAREFLFDDLGHPNARGYAIVADNALRCIVETRIIEDELSVAGPATPPR